MNHATDKSNYSKTSTQTLMVGTF